MNHRHELMKLMRQAAYGHTLCDVFRDFCEMSAISISNAVDWPQREEREARYMQTVKRYDAKTLALFPQMLVHLVEELEAGLDDVLGKTYMELEISNKHSGQFFTPYELCRLMAGIQIDESLKAAISERGFITVNEPAVGGGATIIAFADEFRKAGLDPQTQMHVIAQDLDPRCAHMAYIQLSLLHIPAVVLVGNTLTLEVSSTWYTPAHILGGWTWKLKRGAPISVAPVDPVIIPIPDKAGQFSLFAESA